MTDKEHDDKLMRMKVKSEGVNVSEARLVTKSFALKFLRKAFINARIQVLKNPPKVVREKYKMDEDPRLEVWQVWSGTKAPLVEVCATPDVLPFCCVREAARCRLNMRVRAFLIKGGVRIEAEQIDPHEDHGRVEGATCECFGVPVSHVKCAESGCAVCKGKPFEEAQKLRAELEQKIDMGLDEAMKAAGLEPQPIEDNLAALAPVVADDREDGS